MLFYSFTLLIFNLLLFYSFTILLLYYFTMLYYFATLLNAIKGIDVDDLADTVQSCLQGIKVSAERAQEVHDLIEDLGSQITTAARKLK